MLSFAATWFFTQIAPAPQITALPPTIVQDAGNAAIKCIFAVGPGEINYGAFEYEGWTRDSDGEVSSSRTPVKVRFPDDEDGVRRTCVVEVELESKGDQQAVQDHVSSFLRTPGFQSGVTRVWVHERSRKIQFFPDLTSDRPDIRFVISAL